MTDFTGELAMPSDPPVVDLDALRQAKSRLEAAKANFDDPTTDLSAVRTELVSAALHAFHVVMPGLSELGRLREENARQSADYQRTVKANVELGSALTEAYTVMLEAAVALSKAATETVLFDGSTLWEGRAKEYTALSQRLRAQAAKDRTSGIESPGLQSASVSTSSDAPGLHKGDE